MSRGLGKLQRRLLDELEKRESWTTAIDLALSTQATPPAEHRKKFGKRPSFDRSHLVSVRRALHSLHRRGLVGLSHQGLRWLDSEVYGKNVFIGAEVLAAWLPRHPPPVERFEGGHLNAKRCVRAQSTQDATLTQEPARDGAELAALEKVIAGYQSKCCVPAVAATTQHLDD